MRAAHPAPGTRGGSEQVREVYVHGKLEHRMIDYVDIERGGLRVPVLHDDEQAHFTVCGKCFIVKRVAA